MICSLSAETLHMLISGIAFNAQSDESDTIGDMCITWFAQSIENFFSGGMQQVAVLCVRYFHM